MKPTNIIVYIERTYHIKFERESSTLQQFVIQTLIGTMLTRL